MSANPKLGVVQCKTCDGEADVYQAKRRGAHLYTRCGNCGLNQSSGKPYQNYLWNETKWQGERPTAPTNIDGGQEDQETRYRPPKKEAEPAGDQESNQVSAGGMFGSVAALLSIIVGGLALWKMKKPKQQPQTATHQNKTRY